MHSTSILSVQCPSHISSFMHSTSIFTACLMFPVSCILRVSCLPAFLLNSYTAMVFSLISVYCSPMAILSPPAVTLIILVFLPVCLPSLTTVLCTSISPLLFRSLHRKKGLVTFPSPAGMSPNWRPGGVWKVTSRLGTGMPLTFFYSVSACIPCYNFGSLSLSISLAFQIYIFSFCISLPFLRTWTVLPFSFE